MKLGIDISQIVYEGTGVSRFTRGLIQAILQFDQKNEWIFFFSALRRRLDSVIEKKIRDSGQTLIKSPIPPTLHSFLSNTIHSSLISSALYSFPSHIDWFITSDWAEPPLSTNKATIVHDLAYVRYAETIDKNVLKTQEKRLELVKNEAKIVFSDSKATKEDLVNYSKFDSQKIHVIYPGVEAEQPSDKAIRQTIRKFQLHRPFVLTVGKVEPRKNIKRLIQAFQKLQSDQVDLIIVGQKGWENHDFSQEGANIKYLGYVTDTELYSLYASCLFFIYPSLWEGFGYPVIEAMKLKAPVATSNTSSLSEVGKHASLLFNPFAVEEITAAIRTLLEKPALREELKEKGLERSKYFTWKRYYETMMDILSNY